MISFSVADILKVLEQIPIWKSLVTLPRRLADLENRVAALEGRTRRKVEACPLCSGDMSVQAVRPHPLFGAMGIQEHTYGCAACGHTEKREIDPNRTA